MSAIRCPSCNKPFDLETDTLGACPGCAKVLDVRLFSPIALKVDEAAPALPDDAVCANHPGKRAEHVCAGTGAYICALCAVNTGGEVFSASYLGTAAGKKRTEQAFGTELPRPDSMVGSILLFMFIPYVNILTVIASPFLVPWGFVLLARAARLRREGDPAYARVIRPWRLWLKGIGLAILAVALICLTFVIIGAIARKR